MVKPVRWFPSAASRRNTLAVRIAGRRSPRRKPVRSCPSAKPPSPSTASSHRAPVGVESSRRSVDLDGVLPPDLLVEILLRLTSKSICRLRAVCRSWLSFTSDPYFASAHAARHPLPLLAIGVARNFPTMTVDLMDLSGNVVKRIPQDGIGKVVSITSDLVFIDRNYHSSVLDPTTGSTISVLPHHQYQKHDKYALSAGCVWFAFGRTAGSIGEYKFVRILLKEYDYVSCEVITVSDMNGKWRKMENPPSYLDFFCNSGLVFKGVAYFLLSNYSEPSLIETGCLPSLDLTTEKWSMTLQGPVKTIIEEADGTLDYYCLTNRLSLAELKGTLTIAFSNKRLHVADIWFLVDSDKGSWSKEYRINVLDGIMHGDFFRVQPLLVMDDGKVVLLLKRGSIEMLQIYSPVTNTSLDITQIISNYYGGVPTKEC
uniref:F-box domain-containing protein n=1 Tax=Leersia perrieri TaxID=77586 RepID=A0A0D9WW91_9ORYZ